MPPRVPPAEPADVVKRAAPPVDDATEVVALQSGPSRRNDEGDAAGEWLEVHIDRDDGLG